MARRANGVSAMRDTVLFELEQLDAWLRAHEVEARTDAAFRAIARGAP
jgi:hypothetical protein